jgi:hypothetical protein
MARAMGYSLSPCGLIFRGCTTGVVSIFHVAHPMGVFDDDLHSLKARAVSLSRLTCAMVSGRSTP